MDNEPAFPHVRDNGFAEKPGMTLRDWFAGQALAGLLGNNIDGPNKTIEGQTGHFSGMAYAYADAMLAERAKDSPSHG